MYCKNCSDKIIVIERKIGDFFYCDNCGKLTNEEVSNSRITNAIAHLYIGRKCKAGDLIDEYNKNAK